MIKFLHTFWDTGIRLRCPVCEQGQLFKDLFNMNKSCPHCAVRFERYEGAVVGGMSISIVITALIFMVGYVGSEMLTDWPVWVHLAIWVSFSLFFPIFFYRYSRAWWVVFLHLIGDIHWDYEPYEETTLSIVDAFHNRVDDTPHSTEEEDEDQGGQGGHPFYEKEPA